MLTGEGSQGHININIRGKVFAMLLEMKPIFLPSKRQHDVDLSLLIFCLSTHGKALQTAHQHRGVKCARMHVCMFAL